MSDDADDFANRIDREKYYAPPTRGELWALLAKQVLINKSLLIALHRLKPAGEIEGLEASLQEIEDYTNSLMQQTDATILKDAGDA